MRPPDPNGSRGPGNQPKSPSAEMNLLFEVAGVPVLLEGSSTLASHYAPYRAAIARDPVVRIRIAAPGATPAGDVVRWGDSWLVRQGDELVVGEGNLHTADRLILHAFAGVLADRGVVLAHAASVEGPSGAVAFLGPSGAGKTTAARNCPVPMIHPDRAALGCSPVGAWLAPVPFLYAEPRDRHVGLRPLRALAFVRQSNVTRVRRLAPPEACRRVLSSVLMPDEPRRGQAVLDCVVDLTARVVVLELDARADGGFWSLIAGMESIATGEEGQ